MSSDVIAPARPQRAELAERIVAAVTTVPGVVRVGGGGQVGAATYQGARRITGVAVGRDDIAVHVQVDRLPLPPVVRAVRAAVAAVLRDASWPSADITVTVADLSLQRLPEVAR